MSEQVQKVFRVYAEIVVQAAFDIVAGSDEEAAEMLGTSDVAPVHMEDRMESVVKVLGVVSFDDVSGTTFAENTAEIQRIKAASAQKEKENREFTRQERQEEKCGDDMQEE